MGQDINTNWTWFDTLLILNLNLNFIGSCCGLLSTLADAIDNRQKQFINRFSKEVQRRLTQMKVNHSKNFGIRASRSNLGQIFASTTIRYSFYRLFRYTPLKSYLIGRYAVQCL